MAPDACLAADKGGRHGGSSGRTLEQPIADAAGDKKQGDAERDDDRRRNRHG